MNSCGGVFHNREVITDLTWFRDVIPRSIGVRFVERKSVEAAEQNVATSTGRS